MFSEEVLRERIVKISLNKTYVSDPPSPRGETASLDLVSHPSHTEQISITKLGYLLRVLNYHTTMPFVNAH